MTDRAAEAKSAPEDMDCIDAQPATWRELVDEPDCPRMDILAEAHAKLADDPELTEVASILQEMMDDLDRESRMPAGRSWQGKFRLPPEDEAPMLEHFIALPIQLRVHNVPTPQIIAAALELKPSAAPLLEAWRKVWTKALGETLEKRAQGNEDATCAIEHLALKAKSRANRHADKAANPAMEGRKRDNGDLDHAADGYWDAIEFERHPGLRDWRLHVVDDAARTLALAKAQPYWAGVTHRGTLYVLTGLDDEGLPELTAVNGYGATAHRSRLAKDDNTVNRYWRSRVFRRESGRLLFEGSQASTPFVLADMAAAGHQKAFVKAVGSKAGTWVVNLAGVESPEDAAAAVARVAWRECQRAVVIQEFVPFVLEQRFFVVDGRVAASTSSARALCALDRRAGRILDDRMALLAVPADAPGAYDRGTTQAVVDRAGAARCARLARRFARDVRHEGRLDYVLDVGIAADGRCLAIELNEFSRSGPYAVDHERLVTAHDRRIARYRREVEALRAGVGSLVDVKLKDARLEVGAAEFERIICKAIRLSSPTTQFEIEEGVGVTLLPPAAAFDAKEPVDVEMAVDDCIAEIEAARRSRGLDVGVFASEMVKA